MDIKDLTLNDLGSYIGMGCLLKVGLFKDNNYGFFCNIDTQEMVETRNLSLNYDSTNNIQVLKFNNDFSINIEQYRSTDISIRIGEEAYVLTRRFLK